MHMRARAATRSDAEVLHELRRRSILQLAPTSMSVARAREWANKGSVEFMRQRLEEVEAWVAEEHGEILGWVAVRGDYLDALYVEPARSGQRIGTFLLRLAEEELRRRGIEIVRVDASWNSEGFYLRHDYEFIGPRPPDDARPMRRRLGAEPTATTTSSRIAPRDAHRAESHRRSAGLSR
jgi:putative acetyltransferase